ncbi:MAG: domain S-box protein [Gemmataceae bacterium]|nr:domain S-box protein [Gemmataceae bacterium]
MPARRVFPWPRQWVVILALAALYLAFARLGLALAVPPEKKATAVWPSSGIALAAVLLFGPRVWPGIWLGSVVANLWDYFDPANPFPLATSLGVSSAIAGATTLQALLGAAGLRRWVGGPDPFGRAQDVFRFVAVVLVGCLIASTVGVTSLCRGGIVPWAAYPFTWLTWWLGDVIGILAVTPFVLAWYRPSDLVARPRRTAEAGLLYGLVLGTGFVLFCWPGSWTAGSSPRVYLTVPFLVWAAFRFGQRGTTTTLLLLAALAVWGTALGRGPFFRETLAESLLSLQTFVGVLAVTALVTTAVLAERGQAEERFRAIVEATPSAIWMADRTGTIVLANSRAETMFGYPLRELIGRPLGLLVPERLRGADPGRRGEFFAPPQTRATGGGDLYGRRKDGSEFPVEVSLTPIATAEGLLVLSVVVDVTERKRAESRRDLRFAMTQILTQAAVLTDAIPQILQAVCERLRWDFGAFWTVDRDAGVLRCLATWHPPSARVGQFDALTRTSECVPGTGLPGRVWRSGEPAWIADVGRDPNFPRAPVAAEEGLHGAFGCPIRAGGEILGVIEFVSAEIRQPDADLVEMMGAVGSQIGLFIERKRSEEALRASEIRKTAILETALDCIVTIDHEGRVVEFNPAAEKTFGYRRGEVLGRKMADLIIPPSLREQHFAGMARYLATGDGPILNRRIETTGLRADGTEFPVELVVAPTTSGRHPQFTAYLRDITDRTRAEETVRANEERLRLFVAHTPAAVAMFDRAMRYLLVSRRWMDDYHLGDQDVIGRSHYEVFPDLPPRWKEVHRRCLGGAVERCEEDPFPRPDGTTEWVRWEIHPWRDRAGEIGGVILFNEFITDRKRAAEEIAERVRLAALTGDVGTAITHGTTLADTLQRCAAAMVRHLGVAFARVWTLNDKQTVLELQASAGRYTHLDGPHSRVPVGRLKIGLIAQERRPYLTNAVIGDPRVNDQDWARREGMVAFAGYPLVVDDKLVGVMAVFARAPLSDTTLLALGTIADGIATGIERKHTEDALQLLNATLEDQVAERTRELSRSEEALRMRAQVLEHMVEGVSLVDDRGVIVYTNPAEDAMFGYGPGELHGQPVSVFNADPAGEGRRVAGEILEQLQATGKWSGEVGNRRKSGEGFTTFVRITSLELAGQRHWVAVREDVTERRRAAEELSQKTTDLKTVLGAFPDLYFWMDADGTIRRFHAGMSTYLPPAEFMNRRMPDFLPPEAGGKTQAAIDHVLATGTAAEVETHMPMPDGGDHWFDARALPLPDRQVLLVVRDITARKLAEVARFRLAAIVESAADAVISTTLAGVVTSWNPAAERLFGYTVAEAVGKEIWFLLPPGREDEERQTMERILQGVCNPARVVSPLLGGAAGPVPADASCSQTIESVRRRKDGTLVDVALTISPITDADGNVLGVSKIFRDIGDRKASEKRVRASLEEKEVLLKEIHHRVKNNLQVICSLLSLQARQLGDGRTAEVLHECENRVLAMALIHESLYQSTDLARIDFAAYTRDLTSTLFQSYGPLAEGIRLQIAGAGIILQIEAAVPCGLIVNELVTNCLKHAFPAGRKGEIAIEMRRQGGDQILLTVRDDGVGLPPGLGERDTACLGLRLVRILTTQLRGTLEIHGTGGTTFHIRFAHRGQPAGD